mgnify:CR=1 FL=1
MKYPFDHFPPKEVLWTFFPSIYKPALLVLVTFLILDFFFYFFWNTGPFGVSNEWNVGFSYISVEKTISKNNFFSKYFHIKRVNNYWEKKKIEIVFSTEIYENPTFHTLENPKGPV